MKMFEFFKLKLTELLIHNLTDKKVKLYVDDNSDLIVVRQLETGDVTVNLTQIKGTLEHDLLSEASRIKDDQHTINSVTGLTTALQNLSTTAEAANTTAGEAVATADSVNQALSNHIADNENPHSIESTQQYADVSITALNVQGSYSSGAWGFLQGFFEVIPNSIKDLILKIWEILYDFGLRINRLEIVEPIEVTETFTIGLNHLYKGVRCNSAIAMDCNIPDSTIVAFPVGSVITLQQIGNGVVTIKGAAGVTLNGDINSAGQYKFIQLWKTSANVWNIIGGVS